MGALGWRIYAPLAIIVAGVLIWMLGPVLMPFLLAVGITYAFNPWIVRLERRSGNRLLAVGVVFAFVGLLLVALGLALFPLLYETLTGYVQQAPAFVRKAELTFIEWGLIEARTEDAKVGDWIRANMDKLPNAIEPIMRVVGTVQQSISTLMMLIMLVPVVTFYLMKDWPRILDQMHALVPRDSEPTVMKLVKESDTVLGSFIRGQCMVVFVQMLLFCIGLSLIGVQFALLIGFVVGLLCFIPYLGFVVGITVSSIAAYVTHGELMPIVWVAVLFLVSQALETMVLIPKLLGEQVGLHPVAVLFAVLAGGQLFGFAGVLLAVPATAVLAVFVRHAHERYIESDYYHGGH